MSQCMCQSVLAAMVAAALSSVCVAQYSSGIEGVAQDKSGAVLVGVRIEIRNRATGVSSTTVSSDAGIYRFPALPYGDYSLEAQIAGFQKLVRPHVDVPSGRIVTLNLAMELGAVAESMTISGGVADIDLAQSRASTLLTEEAMENMPLPGRNAFALSALVPGVGGTGRVNVFNGIIGAQDNFANQNVYSLYAAGNRLENNIYKLDDTITNDNSRAGADNISPSPEIIQEMRVAAMDFSAEQGRNSGALVNTYTKYGTNALHGSLYWFFTDDILTSRTVLQSTTNLLPFRRNDFGATLGGPIRKNSTFFFVSVNPLRSAANSISTYSVETPELRSYVIQNFPNTIAAQIFKTAPPQTEPTASIKTVGQIQSTLPGMFPAPTIPASLPAVGVSTIAVSTPRNGTTWTARVDQTFGGGRDRIFGEVYWTNTESERTDPRPNLAARSPSNMRFAKVQWDRTFSPNFFNELEMGGNRRGQVNICSQCQIPSIVIGGVQSYQTQTMPTNSEGNYIEYRDTASVSRGKHTFKFGYETFDEFSITNQAAAQGRPTYTFTNILDFIQDRPYLQSGPEISPKTGQHAGFSGKYVDWYSAVFATDSFRVSTRLTLTLGLRVDTFNHLISTVPLPTAYFQYGTGSNFNQRVANGIVGVRANSLGYTNRRWNWGPRVGMAWDPSGSGKMSVRGGYGIYYDRPEPLGGWQSSRDNPPLYAVPTQDVRQGGQPQYSLGNPDGTGFPIPSALAAGVTLDSHNGIVGQRVSIGGVDDNMKPAMVQNWMLGVQRELVQNLTLEVNYVGSVGHHLYSLTDINRFDGNLSPTNSTLTRLNPSFSTINMIRAVGNSAYNGLTVSLKKRFQHGLSAAAGYTWSRVTDISSVDRSVTIFDIDNLQSQYARADFDVRQKFILQGVWEIPAPWKTGVLKYLSHWNLSAFADMQTGMPFDVYTSASYPTGDFNGDGSNADHPNAPLTPLPSIYSQSKFLTGIFPASAFPHPSPLPQNGNLGRNAYQGPGLAEVDLSLMKRFPIPWFTHEGAKLELRGEASNAFNRVNLANPVGNLTSPQFATSTTSAQSRSFQFALRIQF
jgi:hypothetical protein